MTDSKENLYHFEFRPHYGECYKNQLICINKKHNSKFIVVIDKIINELEQELLDL